MAVSYRLSVISFQLKRDSVTNSLLSEVLQVAEGCYKPLLPTTNENKKIKRPNQPVELTANQRRLAVGVGAFFDVYAEGEVF